MSTTPEVPSSDPDDDIVDELRRRGFGIVFRPRMNSRTNLRMNSRMRTRIGFIFRAPPKDESRSRR